MIYVKKNILYIFHLFLSHKRYEYMSIRKKAGEKEKEFKTSPPETHIALYLDVGLLLQSGSSILQGYGLRHFNLHDGLTDNHSRKCIPHPKRIL